MAMVFHQRPQGVVIVATPSIKTCARFVAGRSERGSKRLKMASIGLVSARDSVPAVDRRLSSAVIITRCRKVTLSGYQHPEKACDRVGSVAANLPAHLFFFFSPPFYENLSVEA
jgi:hypothetical protein